jgi:hypothetical protein
VAGNHPRWENSHEHVGLHDDRPGGPSAALALVIVGLLRGVPLWAASHWPPTPSGAAFCVLLDVPRGVGAILLAVTG